MAGNLDKLIFEVSDIQRHISKDVLVFVHPQRQLDKIGNLLSLPGEVVIEGVQAKGDFRKLVDFSEGRINPDQRISYRSSMMEVNYSLGKLIFNSHELNQIRVLERCVDLPSDVFFSEFSFANGQIDVHDFKAV